MLNLDQPPNRDEKCSFNSHFFAKEKLRIMVSSHFKRNEMHYCENWILIEGTISFGLTCETCNIHYNNGIETCIRACHR